MTFCPVCKMGDPQIITLKGERRLYCPGCQHAARLDANPLDYTNRTIFPGYDKARATDQIAFMEPVFRNGIRIFEVGCAAGDLAHHLKKKVRVARYDGMEISRDAERAACRMDRVYRDWPEWKEVSEVYDLIILSHVLEHFQDIHMEIEMAKAIMAFRGYLCIEVPNGSGHPLLPHDHNPGHLHFFSTISLATLLARHGLSVQRIASGCFETDRYPDSLRVLASAYGAPHATGHELSDRLGLHDKNRLIVWGSGGTTDELLVPYFDAAFIDYFIDKNPAKQGGTKMGKPIHPPECLATESNRTIFISSLEYEAEIRAEIMEKYAGAVKKIISLRELLRFPDQKGAKTFRAFP